MNKPINGFKSRILERLPVIGIWNGIPNAIVAEIIAHSGVDFICIDAEHGPFDLSTVQHQLLALSGHDVFPLVRLPEGRPSLIKQYLDIGCENLLIPMVEEPSTAKTLVQSLKYPPDGIRGVGTALARAAQWNNYSDYFKKADKEVCLIIQVESVKGIENLDALCAVDGIDGILIGPADLAASMGYLGQPGHPDVVEEVVATIQKIVSNGSTAGVLTTDTSIMSRYRQAGASILGIGLDTVLLSKSAKDVAGQFNRFRS